MVSGTVPSLRIGTRGSPLALYQAEETRRRLVAAHGLDPGAIEIVVIRTSGDRIQDRPLAEVGGKGLFTKEIEDALLDGAIDLAVHSSKDMPTVLPDGLELEVFLPRADPRDALIGPSGLTLASLPPGAKIGTASLRRQALVRRARPDVAIVGNFRGNIETRLGKVQTGEVTATLLAAAGLKRLGFDGRITEMLDCDAFLPAVGQGAIGIETRCGDVRTRGLIEAIADADTAVALACERAYLAVLDGSCRTPISGHARLVAGEIAFSGLVASLDGQRVIEVAMRGRPGEAAELGRRAAEDLLRRGAAALIGSVPGPDLPDGRKV